MTVATVSRKGWIVIPAEYRRKYHLRPGSQVRVVDYGGVLSIVPELPDPVREGAGMLKGKTSLVRSLLHERDKELEREQQ